MEEVGAGRETLGAYLLELREATGLGQADFAQKLGIADAYAVKKQSSSAKTRISKFENGHAVPPKHVLDAYAGLSGADAVKLAELAQQAHERRRRTRTTRKPTRALNTTHADIPAPPTDQSPDSDLKGSDRRIGSDDDTSLDDIDRKSWWRRHLVLVAAAVIVLLAGGIGVTIAASSGGSSSNLSVLYARNGAGITVHTCPNIACSGASLPTGSKVQMICFRDAQDVNLNYRSPRWFNIRQHGGTVRGWAHSSEVSHQTHVGRC